MVPLREYVEAIFAEQRRAIDTAEKSAQALRSELERAISEGDKNLRDHIAGQVVQIHAALVSADELERQRIGELTSSLARSMVEARQTLAAYAEQMSQRLDAVRREVLLIQDASAVAIAKADTANEKRFESVNEFRAQLADQSGSFLPREVADAQFTELRRTISELTEKVNRVV